MKQMHDVGVLKVGYPGVKLLSDVSARTQDCHALFAFIGPATLRPWLSVLAL